jgi:hypothetical protein
MAKRKKYIIKFRSNCGIRVTHSFSSRTAVHQRLLDLQTTTMALRRPDSSIGTQIKLLTALLDE